MSCYLKQENVSASLLNGSRFPQMMENVRRVAISRDWDECCTVREIREANSFSEMCSILGITLIYEGNDLFTIDADGAYVSSFFIPFILALAPHVNDGELKVRIERRVYIIRFRGGRAYIACGKYPHHFELLER